MVQRKSRFSDAESRAVLEAAPEGIVVINREGQIVLVNSRTEELLKYEQDELIGMPFDAVLPELFRGEHEQQFAVSAQAPGRKPGRAESELRALCKDGTELKLELSMCPISVRGGPLVCCILREPTGPRPPEQASYETEKQLRQMIENSEDILGIRDSEGRFRYANRSIQRVLGYTQEQVIGSTGFDLIHPEDRPAFDETRTEFLKKPGTRNSIQFRALHANGSWVFLEVAAYNLLDDPNVRGVVINLRDISERKQAEAKRAQLLGELQEAEAKVNPLSGILPICASCKKVKHERGYWQQIETYLKERTPVEFSHGMCPECNKLWYPEYIK
jgi:PAS domain S-box-containing protein